MAIRSIYKFFYNYIESKKYIIYNLVIQLLCNSPKETLTDMHKGYIKDFQSSISRGINCDIHRIEYYTAVTINELGSYVSTWINLKTQCCIKKQVRKE